MNFFQFIDSRLKDVHWYDISLIKLSTAATTLLVAKFFPQILSCDWWVYIAVALVAAIKPLKLIFCQKK